MSGHCINRRKLLKELGYTNGRLPEMLKLKDEFERANIVKYFYNVNIPSVYGGVHVLMTDVLVVMKYIDAKPKRGVHRVFVKCLKCNRWIPFGRYQQHMNRKDHQ